ncbi:MAG TPA: DUF4783 domain-containing protein [Rhodothermales bacterium]|nr:DUF4783 domain-containing protein [Rhodothermales bacterium]
MKTNKRIGLLLFSLLCQMWLPNGLMAQDDGSEVLRKIESGLASNDLRAVLQFASDPIFVRTPEDNASYSPVQARYVLESFFRSQPARGFRFNDLSPGKNAAFATGDFRSRNGQPLRIYVRLRKNGSTWELKEVRITAS